MPSLSERCIDLNADLGEGAAHDAELLDLVTSANIACGVHAGNAALMQKAVALAAAKGVAIGAHPGLADRDGMGRREITITPDACRELVLAQIQALQKIVAKLPTGHIRVRHVKPHGALYNQAARDPALAQAIARAVRAADPALLLFGLAGSALIDAGNAVGLTTIGENFADRATRPDGSLVPRGEPGSVIEDPALAAAQAVALAQNPRVGTICVHGDTPGAVAIARAVRDALIKAGWRLCAP